MKTRFFMPRLSSNTCFCTDRELQQLSDGIMGDVDYDDEHLYADQGECATTSFI